MFFPTESAKASMYDAIYNSDFFSIMVYDRDGVIQEINPYTAALFGKDRSEIIGHTIHEFIPSGDDLSHRRSLEKLLRGDFPVLNYHHSFKRFDGKTAYAGGIARILNLPGEQPLVLSIFKDITDVHEARNSILAKSTMLQAALGDADVMTFAYYPATRTIVNDEAVMPRFRLPEEYEDISQCTLLKRLAPDAQKEFLRIFNDIDAGITHEPIDLFGCDGQHWARLSVKIAKQDDDGRTTMGVGVIADITELKQAQQLREEAEQERQTIAAYTKLILDNTEAVFILLDGDLQLLSAYPGGFKRPDLFKALIPQLPVTDVFNVIFGGLMNHADIDTIVAGLTETLATRQDFHYTFTIEYGSGLHVDLKATSAQGPSGKFGVVVTINNITDLENARAEAESANKAKSAFLANMSHEIRTPMNAIIGISEVALSKQLPADLRNDLQTIQNAGTGLLAIINDILDFSKIESGKFEIIPVEYTLPSLLMDVSNMISTRLTSKPVHLFLNIDPKLPFRLTGDDIRIKQILMNLLGNAVKFTKEGFIELCVDGEFIDDTTFKLTMKVIDSGIGIKPEDIGRLFGTFSQVDTRKNRSISGSGLGLAISKNFAGMMGGDVTVESRYGRGSTFTVTILQQVTDYTPIGEVKNRDSIRVLVLEREESVISSISRNLQKMGVAFDICRDPDHVRSYTDATHVILRRRSWDSLRYKLEFMFPKQNIYLWMENDETPSNDYLEFKQLQLPLMSLQLINAFNGDEIVRSMKSKAFDQSQIIPLTYARVLIVDDNATNLQVAKGLMAPYKMTVDMATSGFKALELLKTTQYDIIFMDHMMPEMDGIETTQYIRKMDGDYYKTVPIVALTANAMSDAKETFLSSGMDDFLAKPIEVRELNRVLKKYVQSKAPDGYIEDYLAQKAAEENAKEQPAPAPAVQTVAAAPIQNAASAAAGGDMLTTLLMQNNALLAQNTLLLQQLLGAAVPAAPVPAPVVPVEPQPAVETAPADDDRQIPGINMAAALEKYGGDTDIYHSILRAYCNDITEYETSLQKMFEARDMKNFTIAVHAIKGASRGVGADSLGELAFSLEKHGKNGDWASIESEYPLFANALHDMVAAVQAYVAAVLPDAQPADEKTSLDGFSADDIQALKSACSDMDYTAAEEILNRMDACSYPPADAEKLKTMLKYCADFEYDLLEDAVHEL